MASFLKNAETSSCFMFLEDVQDDYVDITDTRLQEVFALEDKAERELKSTIFFGKKFGELLKAYSSWRKYNLLFDHCTYIEKLSYNIADLEYKDTSTTEKHVLDVDCTCSLDHFELNKLDATHLEGVVFPEQIFEMPKINFYGYNTVLANGKPTRLEADITLRSIDFPKKVFTMLVEQLKLNNYDIRW